MTEKEAERFWQAKMLQTYKQNMAGVDWQIERRPHGTGFSYCVSEYVCRSKTAEYWPRYRGGIRHGMDLKPYGEDFRATQTQKGDLL